MQRNSPIKRSTPIRRRSKKRAAQHAVYGTLRERYLASHPVCQACDGKRATDIHHKAGRIGEKLNDTTDWMAVCRNCHETIHREPSLARAKGWMK